MCDEDGNALPPQGTGVPGGHPAQTEVMVELEDLGGRTKMVLTHTGIAAGSPGAASHALPVRLRTAERNAASFGHSSGAR